MCSLHPAVDMILTGIGHYVTEVRRFFEHNTPFADGGQMYIYSDGGSSAYSTTLTETTIGL